MVAADPRRPELVCCGTFGRGLWRSADGGATWEPAGAGIAHAEVMAVAVSPTERAGGRGVVWAGTEPSALFRSEDGGARWEERPALREIPSAPTWSFPPRPWTHHVRWIQPDPAVPGRIFVAIELGGVMRSTDGGLTWEDRKPGAKLDAHTLQAHRLAPGRVYEAAGDGWTGDTWRSGEDGLGWTYLWGMAVDPADPGTVVVSASPGPRHAHDARWTAPSIEAWHREPRQTPGWPSPSPRAPVSPAAPSVTVPGVGRPRWAGYAWRGPEAWLYRRTEGGPWQAVMEGLPLARGTRAFVLATPEAEPHVFYASPQTEAIYRSADAGRSWPAIPSPGRTATGWRGCGPWRPPPKADGARRGPRGEAGAPLGRPRPQPGRGGGPPRRGRPGGRAGRSAEQRAAGGGAPPPAPRTPAPTAPAPRQGGPPVTRGRSNHSPTRRRGGRRQRAPSGSADGSSRVQYMQRDARRGM